MDLQAIFMQLPQLGQIGGGICGSRDVHDGLVRTERAENRFRLCPGPAHRRERRFAATFMAVGSTLFAAGSVLAYLVIREGLQVLLGFGGDSVGAALSPDPYFSS